METVGECLAPFVIDGSKKLLNFLLSGISLATPLRCRRRKPLKECRNIFHVLAGQFVRDGLHDAPLWTFIRPLKDRQLLEKIVLMLMSNAGKLFIALSCSAMTTGAGWNPFIRHS